MGRVWADGVRAWMLTPRKERIVRLSPILLGMRCYEHKWTGLPALLYLQSVLTTPDDAATVVTLLRAVVRPEPAVEDRLENVIRWFFQSLSISVFKLTGLDVTFIWWYVPTNFCPAGLAFRLSIQHLLFPCTSHTRVHNHSKSYPSTGYEDNRIKLLYVLQDDNPCFHFILQLPSGKGLQDARPELHLRGFLALRTRLRAAFPALVGISDSKLLALLSYMDGAADIEWMEELARSFAFTRLLTGHPDRGDGQPTAEEKEVGSLGYYGEIEFLEDRDLPVDLGAGGGDDASVVPSSHYPMRWLNIRGLCVHDFSDMHMDEDDEDDGMRSNTEKAVALIDAFYRGD